MMNSKGFISKVELDQDGGILHGEVVNTCDVITVQGQSVVEERCLTPFLSASKLLHSRSAAM